MDKKLLTPGPLTTSLSTKEAMLHDWGSRDINFIEANLMPGLRTGYLYKACLFNLGMSYEQMILTIADNGLSS